MSNTSEEGQKRILELLRSLPHPGKVLIDAVGEGISGFYLRPKSVPQKLDLRDVSLWLMRDEKTFDQGQLFVLNLGSGQWQEWIAQQPAFAIRAEDVGNALSVIEEREKNFNRNLLHKFLDQIHVSIAINSSSIDGLRSNDTYTHYFWEHASNVGGNCHSGDMASVNVAISGVQAWPAIEVMNSSMYVKYWQLLPKSDKPKMQVLLKWHRALVSLRLLIAKDDVCIPIDFAELERTCREEIKNAFEA